MIAIIIVLNFLLFTWQQAVLYERRTYHLYGVSEYQELGARKRSIELKKVIEQICGSFCTTFISFLALCNRRTIRK